MWHYKVISTKTFKNWVGDGWWERREENRVMTTTITTTTTTTTRCRRRCSTKHEETFKWKNTSNGLSCLVSSHFWSFSPWLIQSVFLSIKGIPVVVAFFSMYFVFICLILARKHAYRYHSLFFLYLFKITHKKKVNEVNPLWIYDILFFSLSFSFFRIYYSSSSAFPSTHTVLCECERARALSYMNWIVQFSWLMNWWLSDYAVYVFNSAARAYCRIRLILCCVCVRSECT